MNEIITCTFQSLIREQRFDLFMLLYFGVTELTLEIYYRQQDKRYLCAVSEKNRDEVKKKKKSYSVTSHNTASKKRNISANIYFYLLICT